jgi:succinoglycan biosynthesis transport protein ExoP
MRDVSVADEIYIMLAKRLEEAKVAEVAVSTEVQVVDTATLPEDPIKPKKVLTLLLAAFLGIFGGSGFVIAKELMNRTIKTTDDVANYLDLPVLGSVPDYESLNKNMKKEQQEQSLTARLRRYLWKR